MAAAAGTAALQEWQPCRPALARAPDAPRPRPSPLPRPALNPLPGPAAIPWVARRLAGAADQPGAAPQRRAGRVQPRGAALLPLPLPPLLLLLLPPLLLLLLPPLPPPLPLPLPPLPPPPPLPPLLLLLAPSRACGRARRRLGRRCRVLEGAAPQRRLARPGLPLPCQPAVCCAPLPLQVNLWEAENAVQARYSLHQLQYLAAIIDTSAAKVGWLVGEGAGLAHGWWGAM